jgi:hypothetical protein
LLQPGDLRRLGSPALCRNEIASSQIVADPIPSVALDVGSHDEFDDSQIMSAVKSVTNKDKKLKADTTNRKSADISGSPVELGNPPVTLKAISADQITQNNVFISKMVLAGTSKKKSSKLLVDGMVTSYKGYDAKP